MISIIKVKYNKKNYKFNQCDYWWEIKGNKTKTCHHRFVNNETMYRFCYYESKETDYICAKCARKEWKYISAKMREYILDAHETYRDCENTIK